MTQWKSTRLPSHSNIALTSLARSPFLCLRSRSWWASCACLTLYVHTATLTNYSKHWCWPPKETRYCVCSARFSSACRSLIIHYVISFADTQWALRPALAAAFSLVTAPASLFTFMLFFFQCSVRWCFVLFPMFGDVLMRARAEHVQASRQCFGDDSNPFARSFFGDQFEWFLSWLHCFGLIFTSSF